MSSSDVQADQEENTLAFELAERVAAERRNCRSGGETSELLGKVADGSVRNAVSPFVPFTSSFSQARRSPDLVHHYADGGRGAILEVDAICLLALEGAEPPSSLRPVLYEPERQLRVACAAVSHVLETFEHPKAASGFAHLVAADRLYATMVSMALVCSQLGPLIKPARYSWEDEWRLVSRRARSTVDVTEHQILALPDGALCGRVDLG